VNGNFPARKGRLFLFARADCIGAVLQQLPNENIRAAVKMISENINHTAEIYFKIVVHIYSPV
jgi:hypothetical protein